MNILLPIIYSAVRPSVKTSLWLLKLMLPISLAVQVLGYYGVIEWLAGWIDPVFRYMGLPGASAICFMTGACSTTYAALAVMLSMHLSLRQATILSIMTCICHALPMECTIVHKVGSRPVRMGIIRIIAAFFAAFYLNWALPDLSAGFGGQMMAEHYTTLTAALHGWCISSLKLIVMIFAIIYVLMVIQRVMDDYGLIYRLITPLRPVMRFFGLPENSAYLWLVGNILGISYGSAAMMALEESGQISRSEANDVNYHLIMNHSMLEDTMVFASQGVPALWILSTRILFAFLLVWVRRIYNNIKTNYATDRNTVTTLS